MNKQQLTKNSWISAGLKVLARDGVDAVRVERLARNLKVTKGSFYWHFKDRKALLHALLNAWVARATRDVIDEVERRGGNGQAKIRTLFDIVFSASGRLDLEIRTWGLKDKTVAKALMTVDQTRLKYIEGLFAELGLKPIEATARSRFAYHALIGQFSLGKNNAQIHLSDEQFELIFKMLIQKA